MGLCEIIALGVGREAWKTENLLWLAVNVQEGEVSGLWWEKCFMGCERIGDKAV